MQSKCYIPLQFPGSDFFKDDVISWAKNTLRLLPLGPTAREMDLFEDLSRDESKVIKVIDMHTSGEVRSRLYYPLRLLDNSFSAHTDNYIRIPFIGRRYPLGKEKMC